jgi:hypothetical protein
MVAADCDDGHACTLDSCVVGNVCDHTPLSERCAAGESCTIARGCISSCADDADCDDGDYCNGDERCLAERCAPGAARDCDDGNACTLDRCDSMLASCAYDLALGCDAGVSPTLDGGGPEPFDPTVHYAGDFLVAPTQSLTCPGRATYTIATVSFSVAAGTLTVVADSLTLTQTPAPTGPSFDVTFVDGACASYRLQGTFSDSDNFSGSWAATFGGTCTICSAMSAAVIGARR